MDEFNEFASHFNESMDAALTLGAQTQIQLSARRQALAADEAITASEQEQLAAIDKTATDYAAGFAGLKALIGSENAPGRLQELDARLRAVLPALTGISRERLSEFYARADTSCERVPTATRLLTERRCQISFRDLFAVVQALRAMDDNHCPACLTPIAETTRNPFERAEAGLRELAELATLEADHEGRSWVLKEASASLRAELRKLEEFLETAGRRDSAVFAYLRALPHTRTSRIGGCLSILRVPTRKERRPPWNKSSKRQIEPGRKTPKLERRARMDRQL
jgi:hypothetical protein